MEVYVDEMLVKSLDEEKHLDDFQETFDMLRRYNMFVSICLMMFLPMVICA